MKTIEKARARLLIKHPFFATLTLAAPLEENTSIPTAATDMRKIIYNPKFIEDLNDIELVQFVLAHEVMHIMFKHGLRRQSRDPKLWNIAADYVINLMLRDSGFKIWDKCFISSKYAGMSTEQVYDLLEQEMEKNGGKMPEDGLGSDVLEPSDLAPEEQRELDRKIEQQVAQAANMARMAGKLEGGLERFVNEILNPKVPWQDLLQNYMSRVVHDEESWTRRNRRFDDIYLPSRYNKRMGEVIIIGDTSGSITDEELARVGTEAASIADLAKPESIRLVWADTKVAGEQVFDAHDVITPEPKGGGGTDMRVPLEYAEQFDPQVVILITDGHTPWPEVAPTYPLIVCCTTDTQVPIGEVVRV